MARRAYYCENCGTESPVPAEHCGETMLLVDGVVVVEQDHDEAVYIGNIKSGAITPLNALRQLGDEFWTANASLTRIAEVYNALGEHRRGTEIEVALRIVQEHFSISDDGDFVARSGDGEPCPPDHDQSAWDRGYGIPERP